MMFGGIVGDIAGSTYETDNCKSEDHCRIFNHGSTFTDDTVLTLATAKHFLSGESYTYLYQGFGRSYPYAGYGGNFIQWLDEENPQPYNSWGNGSAMRVSPIGWVAQDLEWALKEAAESASVTHNHPEGIKGAQAVVAAIFLARQAKSKHEIKQYITDAFGYDLTRTVASIRPEYTFDVSCQGSVPEAIIAFLESTDFEDSIRKAISLGGDSDTIACITGSIAHAYYGTIPEPMVEYCRQALDRKQLAIVDKFWQKYQDNSLRDDEL